MKGRTGRPPKYRKEFADQAHKLCLLGYSDSELALFFEVTEETIRVWKLRHAEFSGAVKEGKDLADARVARRLYERAIGYEHEDVYPSSYQGEVTLTPIRKYYPPDTAAATLWLKNRQPARWRDKQEHEVRITSLEELVSGGEPGEG